MFRYLFLVLCCFYVDIKTNVKSSIKMSGFEIEDPDSLIRFFSITNPGLSFSEKDLILFSKLLFAFPEKSMKILKQVGTLNKGLLYLISENMTYQFKDSFIQLDSLVSYSVAIIPSNSTEEDIVNEKKRLKTLNDKNQKKMSLFLFLKKYQKLENDNMIVNYQNKDGIEIIKYKVNDKLVLQDKKLFRSLIELKIEEMNQYKQDF